MKIRWRLSGIAVTLCLLVGLLFLAPLVSAQAITVSVDAPATVAPGDYFTANISISSVTDFDAADFRVVFNPTVLAIDDITPGADITDGLIDGTTIPVAQTNEVSTGTVKVVINVAGTPGVTGSGYLCQIRFHAIGAASTSSTINLENGTLSDKNATAIPATWTGATVQVAAVPPVGGTVYPVNKLAILAPWIAIGAAIIAGASVLMLRRRRT